MLKKLESMKMQKKLKFGYAVVISLMIFSGLVSIAGLSSLYYAKLQRGARSGYRGEAVQD